jgi:integrase
MFKRGGVWWITFRLNNRKIRKSLETDNRKLAETIEAKIKLDIAQGKYFTAIPGKTKTVREMMEKFMTEYAPKRREKTRRSYKTSLNNLLPVFGDMKLADITSDKVSEYVEKRLVTIKPSSVNRETACLSKAFSLAWKRWRWVESNPMLLVEREKEDNERDRWLSYEEEGRLLAECPPRLRAIVVFALNTGIRENAILSLEWGHVDLLRKTATLFKENSKNKNPYTVPLTNNAVEILNEQARVRPPRSKFIFPSTTGGKIDQSWVVQQFPRFLEKAGIDDCRFHDLRHTFGTRLAQAGVDLYLIMKLMGHRDMRSTMRYAHHNTESLRRGISVLNAGHNLDTIAIVGGSVAANAIEKMVRPEGFEPPTY